MTKTVSFTQMKHGSREDYLLLHELETPAVLRPGEVVGLPPLAAAAE